MLNVYIYRYFTIKLSDKVRDLVYSIDGGKDFPIAAWR